MPSLEQSRHSLRTYVGAFAAAGLIAGVALAAIEAVERSFTLRRFLSGSGERLDFATHFALDAPAVALLGAALGLVVGLATIAFRRIRARLAGADGEPTWKHGVAAGAIVVALLGIVVLVAGAPLWPVLLERFAYYSRLRKLVDWTILAQVIPILLALPLGAAVFAVDALLAGRIRAVWRAIAFVLLAVLGAATYALDARALVGLSDDSMHLVLGLVTTGAALACALILYATLARSRFGGRPLTVAVATLAVVAVAGGALAAARLGEDPVVKALFWTRGVLAPRVATALVLVADRDGDGFAAAFGGGDPDDADPSVHPLARDIPGDGIDQNGLGGDYRPEELDPTDTRAFGAIDAPPPGPGRRNVLFITIDTLRADHMSCYGYHRKTTPNMDAFAAEGALFEIAPAQATSTGHSFASMMTGAYGDTIFDPSQPRLGALLASHGYESVPLNSSLQRNFINRDQYWLHYRDIMSTGFTPIETPTGRARQAEQLVDETIAYLQQAPKDRPLFTWLLLRDPHASYRKHAEFDFGNGVLARYDSEIAYTDHHLGRLFRYLEESGLMEETLVVITSDHGESFGEHGDYAHHRRPYWTLANVPLIVRWPGSTGVRVASAAGPIDIAPTVLNWTGIESAARVADRFDGIDLRWQATRPAGALRERAVVTEIARNCQESSFLAWSITQGNLRLIYDAIGHRVELFDIAADPDEKRNLVKERPADAERLLGLLGRWLDRMSQRPSFSGWAQMQPSIWCPAPRYPPLPPRPDEQRDYTGEGDDIAD